MRFILMNSRTPIRNLRIKLASKFPSLLEITLLVEDAIKEFNSGRESQVAAQFFFDELDERVERLQKTFDRWKSEWASTQQGGGGNE